MSQESLEYFVSKSKEFLKEQSDSYVSTHTKAATITAIFSIFIPLFFSVIGNANIYLRWISVIPLFLMIVSVRFMLILLKSRSLTTGFNKENLDNLKNEDKIKIFEFEVGANFSAHETNRKTVEKQHRIFNKGLSFAFYSIVISSIILFINLLIS
jgi:hypothetical protein